jgi:hypothetical protein
MKFRQHERKISSGTIIASSRHSAAYRNGTTPEPTRLPSHQKIKLKTLSYFSTAEKSSFLSTFATQSTTTSPQKHHVLHTVFSKTTLKMPAKRQKPPSQPSQIFSAEDEQKITPK